MTREMQNELNITCAMEYEKALNELKTNDNAIATARRLRSCTACVYTTNNYYILRSYNTLIAVINRNNDTLYDVLRIVYGYTATSAQHVAKFSTDYGAAGWGCTHELTAR